MPLDRAFEHRERLVQAALAEFAEVGFEQASLNRILEAAGMSKGQFYHHFDGKQSLYLALIAQLIQRKHAHFAANPVAPRGGFFGTLRAQLEAGLRFAQAEPDFDRFGRAFLKERGRPIYTAALQAHGLGAEQGLGRLVRAFHAQGAFAPGLDADFVTRAVLLVLNGLPELLDASSPEDIGAGLDQVQQLLERGLGAPTIHTLDDSSQKSSH